MVRQRGSIAKEDLQLGGEVRTLHNGNILMTMFLGWIHKEGNLIERFLKLRTESAQITLSEKHVIFHKPKGRKSDTMTMTFPDLVEEGDLLEVMLDGKVQWERVVNIDFERRKGIYGPSPPPAPFWSTKYWQLASCYADFVFQFVVICHPPPSRTQESNLYIKKNFCRQTLPSYL